MASPISGGYSGSGSGSGSEGDPQQHIMDQRKRKRMQSNRESARRSRMRKQQHLDSLISQTDELKKENSQISTSIGITTELYLNIESENAILRAQMAELSNRLHSLNDIINYINSVSSTTGNHHFIHAHEAQETLFNDCGFMDPFHSLAANQPIMDMLMY
ncbi:bZIP transcription factor 44-like [Arachis stenosperma]|uniref:bZIP transcription factor 44-like n=1 Tax=Arachis stenosperma TaxID=217475 RepID=UPI0025AD4539|nr:bZIP transcription factor 44-like [Arachis stenosperma]